MSAGATLGNRTGVPEWTLIMLQLLRIFWDILLLRRGPADVPHSPTTLVLVIAALLAGNLAFGSVLPEQPGRPTPWLLPAAIALLLCAYWLLLWCFGFGARFVQTVTAILGVSLLLLPAEFVVAAAGSGVLTVPALLRGLVSMAFLALVVYDVYVNARILAAAIERPVALTVVIVVCVQLAIFLGAFFLTGQDLPSLQPAGKQAAGAGST